MLVAVIFGTIGCARAVASVHQTTSIPAEAYVRADEKTRAVVDPRKESCVFPLQSHPLYIRLTHLFPGLDTTFNHGKNGNTRCWRNPEWHDTNRLASQRYRDIELQGIANSLALLEGLSGALNKPVDLSFFGRSRVA